MLIRFIFLFLFIRQAAFQNFLPLINGKPVDIKERPYQVAINVNYVPFIKADCFCGGAIISANYILTAAHTFHNKDYTFVARVGTSDCTWWGTVYYIKDNGIIFHPEFKAEPRLINDLAILEMATEIKFTNEIAQPIVMASGDVSTSNAFVEISGYGRTCFGMDCPESKQLEKIEVNTLTLDECRKYHANILPNMICHIDQNRRWTSCKGDSGGPVTLARSSETVLVGIISYGWECNATDISVSSSIPAFREWIRTITKV